MYKSFYHFLMKYRTNKPNDAISRFANSAYDDLSFPKNSEDYDEISSYLELNVHYPESMAVFDEAWEEYLIAESWKALAENPQESFFCYKTNFYF